MNDIRHDYTPDTVPLRGAVIATLSSIAFEIGVLAGAFATWWWMS